jgi:hypothetical protein
MQAWLEQFSRPFAGGLRCSRGEEVEDQELLDIALISADAFLVNPKLAGMYLQQASEENWTRIGGTQWNNDLVNRGRKKMLKSVSR